MARFLTTIPSNTGFYNFGTVQSYPTGGTGPTAYGPNSYFGSDPRPSEPGDSLHNPIDLGDFSASFRTVTLSNRHGGLTRRVTTFYKIKINRPRSIQFTQDFSEFAYTRETNRNTLIAFYEVLGDGRRIELPINDQGYVSPESSIDYNEEDLRLIDLPSSRLEKGEYLFLITNDIRFMETVYSIGVNVQNIDWRFTDESKDEFLNFEAITAGVEDEVDCGFIAAS